MSLLQRAMGSITRDGDNVPTGPSAERRQARGAGQGGARGSPYARPAGDSWKHDKYDDKPASETAEAGSLAARLAQPASGSGGITPLGPGKGARTSKLIIKDLHYEVSERELELLFVQIGPIATGPKIKFDRSGRSTGIAWIGYTTEQHAQQAKEAFDGALAKGQNIRVEYDFRPDRPAPGSLLARLEPGPRGPRNGSGPGSVGSSNRREGRPHVGRPERGVSGSSEGRSTRNPGSGRERGAGAAARREPKTNDDLDKELEAFMKSPETTNKPAAVPTAPAPAPAAPAAVESNGDVEMS